MKKKAIIRHNFRTEVFERDGHKCVFCDVTENLDAHHITDRSLMPHGGYVKENGISLCEKHHMEAEQYHINEGIIWVDNMHPNDLYEMIGSSYDDAVRQSEEKLKDT